MFFNVLFYFKLCARKKKIIIYSFVATLDKFGSCVYIKKVQIGKIGETRRNRRELIKNE